MLKRLLHLILPTEFFNIPSKPTFWGWEGYIPLGRTLNWSSAMTYKKTDGLAFRAPNPYRLMWGHSSMTAQPA